MNEELTSQPAPGSAYYPVWQKVNDEKWWLYANGDGTTCTPSPCQVVLSTFPGNSTMNNTNFGPPDAAGKNWTHWKADFDYRSEERREGKECRCRWSPDH